MPKFTLEFTTDTPAFDYDRLSEVARCLRQAADLVLSGGTTTLTDLSGTTVGHWTLEPVEEPTPGS